MRRLALGALWRAVQSHQCDEDGHLVSMRRLALGASWPSLSRLSHPTTDKVSMHRFALAAL